MTFKNCVDVFLTWGDGGSEWIARFQYQPDARRFVDRYKWEDRFTSDVDEFGPLLMIYDPSEPYAEGRKLK